MNTTQSAPHLMLGDVEVIRVVEWRGAFAPARHLVPDADDAVWRDNESWLAPDHWDPATDHAVMALQTWVLRSAGRTVLIDTGVGNGRERPGSPQFHHWQGDFLGGLARAGIQPEDVDIVVNTHIHADHVGWNTTASDGEWIPTFPRAQYLVPAADDAFYGPGNIHGPGRREDDRYVYEDSIAPVHHAGQTVLWDGAYRIDEHLTLESAPGHTPGSAILRVASGGDRAAFVGDLLHSPVQILRPSCNSCFCLDAAAAGTSRRRVLERAATERELVVPAHFNGTGIAEVRRDTGTLTVGRWH
ncbi:MBL fold metallo-hydrolase [Streptomyces sp. P9(2023)]|uniref:MBL fold metallo-hydrolase n=1 Tax=Streptomyces sp. P9(2023) TaxID=3064394 RepID=UPI0028F454E6|nr:MBL fold metallo-hydrolase [Streptomyces sp. P9(2023)]MDT9686809.1 MBL fold metallo-hydrolase [Streptomyces sp. P9(2023)]